MYAFRSLRDWDQGANVVARFTVVGEREASGTADGALSGEPVRVARDLELIIDEVYRGPTAAGATFWVRSHEPWIRSAPGSEAMSSSSDDCFQLRVGDQAIGAMLGDGSAADTSAFLTSDSVLILDGDEVLDTARESGVIAELESLTVAELEDRVREAIG